MSLVIFDVQTREGRRQMQARLDRLRATAALTGDAANTVAAIVDDVRQHGDEAVVRYMRKWTDPAFAASRIRVPAEDIRHAPDQLRPELRGAMEHAIKNVRAYQEHIRPLEPQPLLLSGAQLGLRFTPIAPVGLTVPGGSAVLFSTLIMLAVPALVAGVRPQELAVVNPPPTKQKGKAAGDVSPIVLAACALLGIERVYRIGGAQAVAALAYGTESVEKVQMIAGPGNVYVQLAKQQLRGVVGTDGGFYGPSEILTIADETANAAAIAADLLAQAEHNPGKCFLISWSRAVLERIAAEVHNLASHLARAVAIEQSLAEESAFLLVKDQAHAVEWANEIAAEHVNLAVKEPEKLLGAVVNGGEFFLGDATPVAAGDYYAGPSHCLPTGATARFSSGVSVYTFLKRSGTVSYPAGMPPRVIEDIAILSEAEGLTAHAASVRARQAKQ